ncbi:LysR family transcriptional regulator [Cobetia sp. 3AK]|uniref:LysR family transcriptional regulator n=1 Tax=Cobetia marina TaxID=28258 RepID=A0ABU9GFX7_COBMA|nr:LysR family transcriptional regulator [Cobetia sp. 3AK]MDH2375373.1 LysR family transcriptional regulator [Cobetia sp. 3AK]
MLQPQWLRTFRTLVSVGNFTRTAEQLDLTQAAVSQHVRHLETQLGKLLIRHPRKLELTPAGHALLDYAREMETAEQRLAQRLAGNEDSHGDIRLITPGSIGLALYPRLLALQQASPGLNIHHRFAPTREVVESVLENRFELGIVTQKPDDPRLSVTELTREPLELVVPAGVEIHDWRDLETLGFIDHPDGQDMASRLLSRRFPGNPGVRSLPRSGSTNQISLILEPVARGLGFSVVPRHAREAFQNPQAIKVVAPADGDVEVVDTLWWITRAEWPLSARARRVQRDLQAGL